MGVYAGIWGYGGGGRRCCGCGAPAAAGGKLMPSELYHQGGVRKSHIEARSSSKAYPILKTPTFVFFPNGNRSENVAGNGNINNMQRTYRSGAIPGDSSASGSKWDVGGPPGRSSAPLQFGSAGSQAQRAGTICRHMKGVGIHCARVL